jgi:hypothetical protein
MVMSGMAGMLKALGVDPDELKANVETFMVNMKAQAETINANQARLEAQGARIEGKLDAVLTRFDELSPASSTKEVLEDGKPTGVLITSERFPQAMIDDVNGGQADGR